MINKVLILLLAFCSLIATSAFAKDGSDQPVHRQIKWSEPVTNRSGKTPVKALHFKGCMYDVNDVPQYIERFPLANAAVQVSAKLTGMQTAPLKESALLKNTKKIGKEITVKAEIVVEKKVAFVQVSFIPVVKNESGYEKVVSFDLSITTQPKESATRVQARYYAPASVLATGNWYKIGVVSEGIYQLTYQNLKDLGMNVDSISPQNIRIYGNGGAMLPFANSVPRYDDLQENAIFVQGQNDAKFTASDYILFFGESTARWTYSTCDNHYHHQVNWYSDTAYYFITADLGPGKRIQSEPSSPAAATETVTTFDDYQYHELDAINFLQSGRQWYGEAFNEINNSLSFQFNFPNHVGPFFVISDVWAASVNEPSSFTLTSGNSTLTQSVPPLPDVEFAPFAYECAANTSCATDLNGNTGDSVSFSSPADVLSLNLTYIPNSLNPQGDGWLNFLEVNAHRVLTMAGGSNQLEFRKASIVGAGQTAQYNLGGVSTSTTVWDITNPLNITNVVPSSNAGGVFTFSLPADSMRQFMAFSGSTYYSPTLVGHIANQNLHGLPQTDMVIVAHPDFMSAALQLAQFHRNHDKITVQVVTPQQVYNEYSSGKQDVSAIRDFMEMFYDRGSGNTLPQYLLLFGRGSYDPKYRVPDNTDFIVCYESANSYDPTQSYMSDDVFAFLDSNEGDWDSNQTNLMDVGVGRLPAVTSAEAQTMVNKIINYVTPGTFSTGQTCSGGASSSLGDWRNILVFVADEGNGDVFVQQSEAQDTAIGDAHRNYNIDKIYMNSYQEVATPGGNRYPAAEAAVVQRVQQGALLVNYIGHGGPLGWSNDRFLTDDDINGWTNYNALPAFMTATCEFTTADNPAITSSGELVLENPNGGGIALFTTCRLSYSESNFELGNVFYSNFFTPIGNKMPTVGQICMNTKNEYMSEQTRNFLLLGDPVLTLAYPKWDITTTTINSKPVTRTSTPDTIKALQKVTIGGYVDDGNGKKLTNFNGTIYPTVYDKPVTLSLIGNDPPNDYPMDFQLQNSILYKGAASVVNGDFTFTFVVPKDIAYQYGYGRLSYYADNQTVDASGNFENFIIGGASAKAPIYTKGPVVKLYMNDTTFAYGGLTNQNPSLYALIYDSSGVSTVGNGIGHDITAELDNNNNEIYVLNNYYQANLNSYQSGKVTYAFSGLSNGPHSVTFKVWDVYDISTVATLDFVVASSTTLTLDHVFNYPNPFTTNTKFFFEYNEPCMPLVVQIQIYTVSGKIIKTIRTDVQCDGFRSASISWNGLDDYGDKIGRGVYIYQLKVHAADGSEADKYEKLVVLR